MKTIACSTCGTSSTVLPGRRVACPVCGNPLVASKNPIPAPKVVTVADARHVPTGPRKARKAAPAPETA